MYQIFQVGAVPGSEAFLLVTEEKTALIDSGFAFCAHKMIENMKRILRERPLDYVLLTHSHYDHASGSAYCRLEWENVKVVASEYTKRIFEKPSAKEVMRNMNDNAAKLFGVERYNDKIDVLSVDVTVTEGDIIDLGSMKLKTIEAPGHTKCSIAFFSEEESLFISCETMGIPIDKNTVMPGYLVGYDMSMNAIKKAMGYDAKNILLPHIGEIREEQAKSFFSDCLYWAEKVKNNVVGGHKEGKTNEELIAAFKEQFYTKETAKLQPEKAFLLNASYTIPMLIKECG